MCGGMALSIVFCIATFLYFFEPFFIRLPLSVSH
jgi:hypothetical protein